MTHHTISGGGGVILPAMSQFTLDHCPQAEASWYDGVGHAPFLENPGRFNRELAHFVQGP